MLKKVEKYLSNKFPTFKSIHRYSTLLMMGDEYISVRFKITVDGKIIEKDDMFLLKELDESEEV